MPFAFALKQTAILFIIYSVFIVLYKPDIFMSDY